MSEVFETTPTAIQWLVEDASDSNFTLTGSNNGSAGILTASSALGTQYILGIDTDASQNKSVANVEYVQSQLSGQNAKDSCALVITDNIDITSDSYHAGQVVQSYTLVAGDRILLTGQSTAAENGPYEVQTGADLTRPSDFNASAEVPGARFWITEGTGEGSQYIVTAPVNASGFTLGSDAITFTSIDSGSYTAGDGIQLSGSEFSVDLKANGGLVIESQELAVDLAASSITGQLAFSNLAALTDGNILVGDGSNEAASVAVSGDATLANTGALTIANDAVSTDKIADNAVTLAKMEDGTEGQIIYYDTGGVPARLGVGTDGQVLTVASGKPAWAAASGGGGTPDDGSVTLAKIADFAEDSIIVGTGESTDPQYLAVGAASTVLQVDASGDLQYGTVTSAMIADDTIVNADISSSAAIEYSKLVTMSGDATIAANGELTIANGAVELAMMEDGTEGQIIYYETGGTPTRLNAGSEGQVLTVTSGKPAWAAASGGGGTPDDGSVTLAKIADFAEDSLIIGTGESTDPQYLAVGAASTVLQVDASGDLQYGTVTSAMIADDTIVNADISSSAAISASKVDIQTLSQGGNDIQTFSYDGQSTATVQLATQLQDVTRVTNSGLDYVGLDTSTNVDFSTASEVRVNISGTGDCLRVTASKTYARGGTQSYSDKRIKQIVGPIDDPLERICKLNAVLYHLLDRDGNAEPDIEMGFVAQDMLKSGAAPELVRIIKGEVCGEEVEDLHTINYAQGMALTVEGIKALKAENDALKAALAALTARVAALE